MQYLHTTTTQKPISKIALGTTYFGSGIDEQSAFSMLDLFASQGGTTIDTARVYGQLTSGGPSSSELVIGRWLQQNGMHKKMVVVTKGLFPSEQGYSRFSQANLSDDIKRSQDELQTDSFDVWFLHRDDLQMPVGKIMEMLHPFVESQTIRTLGASNWTTRRIQEANTYAREHRLAPFSISELQWSLATTTAEKMGDPTLGCMDEESLRWYSKHQMPVFAFSSQAKGFFSKFIDDGEANLNQKIRSRFLTAENRERAERVRALSQQLLVSPAAITLGFLMHQEVDTVAIVGCSTVEQLKDSLSAKDLVLDRDHLNLLLGRR